MNFIDKNPQKVIARIISIGDELICNGTVNSNASQLSSHLEKLGIKVRKTISIGDQEEDIIEEIHSHIRTEENILILTGGLGPTRDDLTVSAVAKALEVKEVINPSYLVYLKKIRQDRQLPEQFLKQAIVPQGFTVNKSPYGSAPFLYRLDKPGISERLKMEIPHLLVLLPGVPYECLSLFTHKVIPLIQKIFPNLDHHRHFKELKIISVPESLVEEGLEKIHQKLNKGQNDQRDIKVAFLPSLGELLVRLRGDSPDYLKKLSRELRTSFPNHQSYTSPLDVPIPSVAERLHHFLMIKKWRVGFAESCTGGLLTSQMVSFPGSSSYLDSGVVTYSNESKIAMCGVTAKTLKKHGAVSPETALEMAIGLARKRKLHFTISITGIAGPEGSKRNRKKQVGLIYIGLYYQPPGKKITTITRKFIFSPPLNQSSKVPKKKPKLGGQFHIQSRNRIQERAVKNALFMMMEACFPKP